MRRLVGSLIVAVVSGLILAAIEKLGGTMKVVSWLWDAFGKPMWPMWAAIILGGLYWLIRGLIDELTCLHSKIEDESKILRSKIENTTAQLTTIFQVYPEIKRKIENHKK